MEIKILQEAGYTLALQGMRFSHKEECELDEIPDLDLAGIGKAHSLASRDNGHNKFLESIIVWFDIRAPLYFWKQFDTYRVGITKQSKSTMHTLMKSDLGLTDFSELVDSETVWKIKDWIYEDNFLKAVANLPDGYLQTRRVCCSYKTLRGIIKQRSYHKLGDWRYFCDFMKENLEHPRLLGDDIV